MQVESNAIIVCCRCQTSVSTTTETQSPENFRGWIETGDGWVCPDCTLPFGLDETELEVDPLDIIW